jgi:hypothetical protein
LQRVCSAFAGRLRWSRGVSCALLLGPPDFVNVFLCGLNWLLLEITRAASEDVFRASAVVSGSFEAFLMRVFRSLTRVAAVLLQLFGVFLCVWIDLDDRFD